MAIGRNPNGIGGSTPRSPILVNGARRARLAVVEVAGARPAAAEPVASEVAFRWLSWRSRQIAVRFGGLQALQDVNLDVHAGAGRPG